MFKDEELSDVTVAVGLHTSGVMIRQISRGCRWLLPHIALFH